MQVICLLQKYRIIKQMSAKYSCLIIEEDSTWYLLGESVIDYHIEPPIEGFKITVDIINISKDNSFATWYPDTKQITWSAYPLLLFKPVCPAVWELYFLITVPNNLLGRKCDTSSYIHFLGMLIITNFSISLAHSFDCKIQLKNSVSKHRIMKSSVVIL